MPLRSASDDEFLGAHDQLIGDTLAASASNGHLGAGWQWRDGELTFDREQTAGTPAQHTHDGEACSAPLRGPQSPAEIEARLALARALWEAQRSSEAAAVVATADDDAWLSCQH